MGNGTPNEPEVDVRRGLEPDRLDRRRNEPADLREVSSEDHVLTAFEHLELLLECARGATQIWIRDDLEDELARRIDPNGERPQGPHPSADPEVERERAAYKQRPEPDHAAGDTGERPGPHDAVAASMRLLRLLSASAIGYLLGTVPSSEIASHLAAGELVDPRSAGSRNPGATNARRLFGRRLGHAVMVADIGKGFVACGLGRRIAGDAGAHVAGVAAVVGHCYPAWTRFRGGKGVATSFGQCLYTFPAYAPVDVAVAMTVARIPGLRRPALASVAVSSGAWLWASFQWWRRGLPNLWGPRPTGALPLANAATVLVIASKALPMLRHGEPDELTLPRGLM